MMTLHVAPGPSAAVSLREALRIAGRDEEVLTFCDDLSCGPIAIDGPQSRSAWWAEQFDWPGREEELQVFRDRLMAADICPIIWFGGYAAHELAFRMEFARLMAGRHYSYIDVTGLRFEVRWANGSEGEVRRAKAVSEMPPLALAELIGTEQPAVMETERRCWRDWDQLRKENAPFRIVTPAGLRSVPLTYFDQRVLDHTGADWTPAALVIGRALGAGEDPYYQVGDLSLHQRLIALVDKGTLEAEGDPREIRACKVRISPRLQA
jgi:hypothetical protein